MLFITGVNSVYIKQEDFSQSLHENKFDILVVWINQEDTGSACERYVSLGGYDDEAIDKTEKAFFKVER